MRIEFVGAPTTGKSTIARVLRENGVRKGLWPGIEHPWTEFQEHVEEFMARHNFSDNLEQRVLSRLKVAYAHDKSPLWHVSDELCIQSGISLAIRAKEDWHWYFREVPLPDLLIYLKANNRTIQARNDARGGTGRFEKSMRVIALTSRVMKILRNRDCQIIEFWTDKMTPEEITKDILGVL